MPKWARLSTTSDKPLRDRMADAIENGYGGEGPLAKVLAYGGCFGAILLGFLFVMGIFGGVGWFLWWLGHQVF